MAPCTVKLPEIWPVPPRIGSRICGAEITWSSRMIANSLPTFCCVACAEALRALGVEAERDNRLVGALVEGGLRVDEVLAGNDDPVLDEIGNRRIVGRIHYRRAGGRAAFDRLLHRHRLVDHLEGQLGGLPENVLQPLRILQARHLDQDAVDPWRWMIGSVVPSSLTRRPTTSIDCVSAEPSR